MVIRPLEVEKETPCTSANSLSYGKDEQNVSNSQTPDLLFKDAIYIFKTYKFYIYSLCLLNHILESVSGLTFSMTFCLFLYQKHTFKYYYLIIFSITWQLYIILLFKMSMHILPSYSSTKISEKQCPTQKITL